MENLFNLKLLVSQNQVMLKNNVTQRPLSELQSIVDSTEYDLPENMKMSRKTNIKPQHAYKAFDL